MKYFDTHTHTNLEPLSEEFTQILAKLEELDMGINIVGCDIESSLLAVKQAQQSPLLYCSIGIHPNDAKNYLNIQETIAILENLYLENKQKVVCIGECGLDYFRTTDPLEKQHQKAMLQAQILLAHKHHLPVMLHIRDAHEDAIDVIKENSNLNITWIIHCFSSNADHAQKYVDLNCYISIPGIVTFKNADDLRQALSLIPLDLLLTETDAPWLTPAPYRGKTNYPYYVVNTNEFISKFLNIDPQDLNKKLLSNACKALNISAKI